MMGPITEPWRMVVIWLALITVGRVGDFYTQASFKALFLMEQWF